MDSSSSSTDNIIEEKPLIIVHTSHR
ncbi:hypothetical protein Bhyg_05056 [Pseudolycoriella hygida]|uniref:Uncharacterized protein n=1 Tax=Pseudolycoriella hygida TaxID=35572 RepID=A0A9Q0NHL3_9DIPT|nr:hypothetical protein Bhyg_05056 [Pseudolycoriella hygida]